MKYKLLIRLLLPVAIMTCVVGSVCAQKITIHRTHCERLENPQGIDVLKPRLGWEILSDQQNVKQTAYRILVATSLEKLNRDMGDLWDSGTVLSDNSLFILYEGKPLKTGATCFWKVQVTTNKGRSAWSKSASWTMGLLEPGDWTAQWIGLDKTFPGDALANKSRLSARYLRKTFQTKPSTITEARLYIVGLGLYEAYINGTKVGDQVLAPTLTDYTKSVKYNTFDVTDLLRNQSQHALSVVLGNGRYFSTRFEGSGRMRHFGYPKLLAQLVVTYSNGSIQVIASDTTWKITPDGPLRANNEFDGETYDARKELTGWNTPVYDDSRWLQAETVEAPKGRLSAQLNRNIKVMETLKPKQIKALNTNQYMLDMGQNMVGWLQIKVRAQRGDTIRMRFAETLKSDGSLYTANLRGADAIDWYVCKGGGEETWEPQFVYHGFRYVEVTGARFNLDDFTGKVIYDEMETTGHFSTSDTTLNQLYQSGYWGIRGNYRSLPTDCPQRDERQGWLGDRTTGAYGENFIFGAYGLYVKWLQDIEEAQRTDGSIPDVAPIFWNWQGYTDNMTWPHAYLTVSDMLYRQYGDLQPIRQHYASIKKWMDYMRDKYLQEGIMTRDKYGDWCVPPESPKLIHSKDSTRMTNAPLLGTAYYYRSLWLMEQFAGLLGLSDDQLAFAREMLTVKQAFNKRFFNEKRGCYDNNTVTANLIPLCFKLVPEPYEEAVFQNLVKTIDTVHNNHVGTGLIGIQWLMRGLTQYGRGDLALKIATNRTYPSWGYMMENGATTIWELWNGNTADPKMNSGNHVMLLGDVNIWFFEYLGGIRNADSSAGFKTIELNPTFMEGLNSVDCSYHSPHGMIESRWKRDGQHIIWSFTIPCNTTANVFLPGKKGTTVKRFGSGKYKLSFKF